MRFSSFRRSSFLGLLLFLTTPGVQAQEVSYLPQVGDGQFGSIIRLITEFIFVNSGTDAQVNLAFKLPDGNPMPLNLVGIGSVTEHDFILRRGESARFSTLGEGAPSVGYAVVTAGGPLAGGSSGSGVGGTGVFTQIDVPSGTIINEAGVPLVKELSSFSLFVDTTGTRDTALAIVNPPGPGILGGGGGPTTTAQVNLFNTSFEQIAASNVPLAPGQRISDFVSGIFDPEVVPEINDMVGSMTVRSSLLAGGGGIGAPLAALTVRTNNLGAAFPEGVPTFTPFPVVPGAAFLVSTGVAGTVTRESTGTLNVTLDLRESVRPVKGAIFYLFDRGELISERVRSVDTNDSASFLFEVPGRLGSATATSVEVRLIYEGGEITRRMPVQ